MIREQRILSIWWPRLAIERWREDARERTSPDAAVVLVVEARARPVIHAATDAAAERARGSAPG